MSQLPPDRDLFHQARDLARKVAGEFHNLRRTDLEVEMIRLAYSQLKSPPPNADNLIPYVIGSLWHLGLKQKGKWQRQQSKEVTVDDWVLDSKAARESTSQFRLEITDALRKLATTLPEKVLRFMEALPENNFEIGAASRACGIHRNTGTAYLKICRTQLEASGFCAQPACAETPPARPLPVESEMPTTTVTFSDTQGFVMVPTALLEWLMQLRLSGTEFRIAIWVIRNTYGWHRGNVAFSWYGIAQALQMDRGGTVRAGNHLIKAEVLVVTGGPARGRKRIGFSDRFGPVPDKKAMSAVIAKRDVKKQRNRCQASSDFRRAKERSKEKNIYTSGGKPPQGEEGRGHTAGEARPVPGKYRDLDSSN